MSSAWIDRCLDMGLEADVAIWLTPHYRNGYHDNWYGSGSCGDGYGGGSGRGYDSGRGNGAFLDGGGQTQMLHGGGLGNGSTHRYAFDILYRLLYLGYRQLYMTFPGEPDD